LSALLPDQLRQQFNGLEQLLLLQDKWPAFQLEALVNQVDQEHGEMGMGVNNDFPLARRCKATLDAVKTAKPELAAAS
jgi:serine/threonine-protein kinase